LNPEGELSFGPITTPVRNLITRELPAPGVENSAQPSTPEGQLVPFVAPLQSELDSCDDPAWPLEASKEDREAGIALPVPPVPDNTGPISGFESPSWDGGSPLPAEESNPEEAESPEEQGPLSAAPSTSVGIATPALLPPAGSTTTITAIAKRKAILLERYYDAYPDERPRSVSQESKAPPPKAPQGYDGQQPSSPPVRASPGDVAEATTPTPEPRPLSAAPSTSVGTVSAGIVFPLATPADDLLPTFPTDEESDAGAQRPSPMNVDSERASQEAALNKSPPRSAVPTSEPKRYRLDVPVSLESESEEEDSFGNRPIAPTRVFLDSDGPPKGVHIILLGGSPGFGV
jgi:hypothetical protein